MKSRLTARECDRIVTMLRDTNAPVEEIATAFKVAALTITNLARSRSINITGRK